MARKTPPCKNYPAWTEARYNAFVRSALRKAWSRWPPKFEVLKENRRTVIGKRWRYEYKCAKCKKWFQQKYVQVDHIIPVGSHVNWDTFIEKLLVGKDKLQLLCKPCHAVKTKSERSK